MNESIYKTPPLISPLEGHKISFKDSEKLFLSLYNVKKVTLTKLFSAFFFQNKNFRFLAKNEPNNVEYPQCAEAKCYPKKKGAILNSSNSKNLA